MIIHLINIGCKVNYAETSRLSEIFAQKGHIISNKPQEADVILINTCTVTNKADADCRAAIRKARRSSSDAFIGVFGCYAQLNADVIGAMPEVNAVFGIKEKFSIPEMLEDAINSKTPTIRVSKLDDLPFDLGFTNDKQARARAFLKIQDGCNYRCSYCTIPNARGDSRSYDFDLLPDIFAKIADSGYKELVLSGINLGEFNHNGKKFEDVLELIANNDYGLRFRISSIEPNLINDNLINLICHSSNICPHFHIPLQSGSNTILNSMKRRYQREFFAEQILKINSSNPNACIGIDVICGFPGETEILFQEALNFIDSLPISYIHAFTYSERNNTLAAEFPDIVPVGIRKSRTKAIRTLSDNKYKSFYDSQIGLSGFLLPENFNRKDNYFVGHTENYIKCKVDYKEEPDRNSIYRVKYLKVENMTMMSQICSKVNT